MARRGHAHVRSHFRADRCVRSRSIPRARARAREANGFGAVLTDSFECGAAPTTPEILHKKVKAHLYE